VRPWPPTQGWALAGRRARRLQPAARHRLRPDDDLGPRPCVKLLCQAWRPVALRRDRHRPPLPVRPEEATLRAGASPSPSAAPTTAAVAARQSRPLRPLRPLDVRLRWQKVPRLGRTGEPRRGLLHRYHDPRTRPDVTPLRRARRSVAPRPGAPPTPVHPVDEARRTSGSLYRTTAPTGGPEATRPLRPCATLQIRIVRRDARARGPRRESRPVLRDRRVGRLARLRRQAGRLIARRPSGTPRHAKPDRPHRAIHPAGAPCRGGIPTVGPEATRATPVTGAPPGPASRFLVISGGADRFSARLGRGSIPTCCVAESLGAVHRGGIRPNRPHVRMAGTRGKAAGAGYDSTPSKSHSPKLRCSLSQFHYT
jgi:hypothetical protein